MTSYSHLIKKEDLALLLAMKLSGRLTVPCIFYSLFCSFTPYRDNEVEIYPRLQKPAVEGLGYLPGSFMELSSETRPLLTRKMMIINTGRCKECLII